MNKTRLSKLLEKENLKKAAMRLKKRLYVQDWREASFLTFIAFANEKRCTDVGIDLNSVDLSSASFHHKQLSAFVNDCMNEAFTHDEMRKIAAELRCVNPQA